MSLHRQALLIVDMQALFIGYGATEIQGQIGNLVREWNPADVFYTAVGYPPGLYRANSLHWCRDLSREQLDVIEGVLLPSARVYERHGYGLPRELISLLTTYDSVAVCGMETDRSVTGACLFLWEAGIALVVLSDLCASSSGTSHHLAALDLLIHLFGPEAVRQSNLNAPAVTG